jgi:hypothetical protein
VCDTMVDADGSAWSWRVALHPPHTIFDCEVPRTVDRTLRAHVVICDAKDVSTQVLSRKGEAIVLVQRSMNPSG